MNQSLGRQDSALSDSIKEAVKGRLDIEEAVSQRLRDIMAAGRRFHGL